MANILDPKPELLVKEIDDTFLKKNFMNLKEFFEAQNQLLDFKFFTVKFEKAEKNVKVAHSISRTPKDILFTSMSGNQEVTFNLGLFDGQNMDISVSGPCTVSFFAGTYWKDSQRTIDSADAISFGSSAKSSSSSVGSSGKSGIIEAFAGPISKIPKGCLLCDGSSYNVKDYPDLAEALLEGGRYAWGGGSGKFNVPDLRGQFLRGTSVGSDGDPDVSSRFSKNGGNAGNAAGSFQNDAFQNHKHQGLRTTYFNNGIPPGGNSTSSSPDQNAPGAPVVINVGGVDYGTPRVSLETRPKNAAVNWVIRT